MLSLKIVMRAWNAGRAAVTARLMQFQWRQALAVLLLSSTLCWGERVANVRAALNPPTQQQSKADAVADTPCTSKAISAKIERRPDDPCIL
jgi:hypothetical protein